MSDPADSLILAVYPPAIDVSTAANKQVFNPQFGIANIGTGEVSITKALLQVPVSTTGGTNLASNTDMAPNAITENWNFSSTTATKSGYVAFELVPRDGVGTVPANGSIAFALNGVDVATVVGAAVLLFEAKTSLGPWTTEAEIELTTPSTTPTITRFSVTPADPQTLTTLQGQQVVISWTSSGAAYCAMEDDQGIKWLNLPTGGTISDTPAVGDATIVEDPVLGRYYSRTYTLEASAAGAVESDHRSGPVAIQLPTILSFSVSPATIESITDTVTASWSVSGIDPDKGQITLTVAPADGTGPYTIDIPPGQANGSGIVTPTPLTTTVYSLAAESGYGLTAPAWPAQSVTSQMPPGFVPMGGLNPSHARQLGLCLGTFAGRLWCAWSTDAGTELSVSADGIGWSVVTPNPALPPIDGLVVATDAGVETLWAFGADANGPFVASSVDGGTWTMQPTPPYRARRHAGYAAIAGTLYVAGGTVLPPYFAVFDDVWSTPDGRVWAQESGQYNSGNPWPAPLAAFAGNLWTMTSYSMDNLPMLRPTSSSDGGATWVGQADPPTFLGGWGAVLQPVRDQLWLLGIGADGTNFRGPVPGPEVGLMNKDGSWTGLAWQLPFDGRTEAFLSSCEFSGYVWIGVLGLDPRFPSGPRFAFLNQILPGTTFTLAPPREGARR